MRYTYKNINVDVETLNPNHIDQTGETIMTIKSTFVSELIENCCSFCEFFLHYQMEKLFNELDRDTEKAKLYFDNLNEDVEINSADAIIAVYEYALQEEKKEFIFEVSTENISWIIHDILHARHDAAGCTIYVEADIEKERILESLSITKDLFPSEVPSYSFLENLENEFYERFGNHLNLEKFKEFHMELYEE